MQSAMIQTKKCPFCAEQIQVEAIKCRHCQEIIDPEIRNGLAERERRSADRIERAIVTTPPLNRGLCAVLSFVVPGLGQMYAGKIGAALAWFICIVAGYFCFILPGLILHFLCIVNAATQKG